MIILGSLIIIAIAILYIIGSSGNNFNEPFD